jgi:phospholipase/carboxylesterase
VFLIGVLPQRLNLSLSQLHGLGDSAEGFYPLFWHMLTQFDVRGVKVILPDAPTRPVTINGGMVMKAWYDIMNLDARSDDTEGIEKV